MSGRWHQVRVVVRPVTGSGPSVRFERDGPRGRAALSVVRLARVRAENVDRHQPNGERADHSLVVHGGRHWQHSVGAPPRDDRPRPAESVALQHGGRVQGGHQGRALLTDHVGRSVDRICARNDGVGPRVNVVALLVSKKDTGCKKRKQNTCANTIYMHAVSEG